jgi:hypothetical protein
VLAISLLPGRAGLRLEGEVDLFNQERLRAALATLPPTGSDEVILDLGGLRFIDIAGTRALMAPTQWSPGLRLVLYDPPASLCHLIGLVWPDAKVELRSWCDSGGTARIGAAPPPDGHGPAVA